MKTPAVALVGCGAVAELYYAPALRELQKRGWARLAWIVDPAAARRQALAAEFPEARPVEAAEGIGEAPDLAIIASPAQYHAAQAEYFLRKRVAVLCEKPMAADVASAESMIRAADESGALLGVGLFRRFFPAAQMIRDFIQNQTLGRAVSFEFTEGGAFNWPAQSASFFEKKTAQGGVFLDLGVHSLDLAIWWFGDPVELEYEDDAMGGLEINALMRARFGEGTQGSIRLSRDWELPNRYVIQFEKGWMAWKVGDANRVEIGGTGGALAVRGEICRDGEATRTYPQSFIAQILNMLRALGGGERVAVDGREGIRSLRVIENCYAQKRLMAMPWLTAAEIDGAKRMAGM